MLLLFAAALTIPLGLDLYMPVPEDNPVTPKKSNKGGASSPTAASPATAPSPAPLATIRNALFPTAVR